MEKIIAITLLVFMVWVLVMGSALTLPAAIALRHFSLLLG
jgi:uncharacterized membrane-anchored protein